MSLVSHFCFALFDRADQRGVSGSLKRGCEAIIVSGRQPGEDNFKNLVYTATNRQGGGAMLRSLKEKFPIRVFRSSDSNNPYRPSARANGATAYRYDGVYHIAQVCYKREDGSSAKETSSNVSAAKPNRSYSFHMQRCCVKGKRWNSKLLKGNRLSTKRTQPHRACRR